MTVSDVLTLLDAERDERGMRNWEKLGSRTAGLKSYGIGLTRLRKLAKRIGRNRELAHALWKTDVYEARVIALLVDDPVQITREQAEKQVEELAGGMLAHVFASCDTTLAKTSFVVELADEWVRSDDPVRRASGYGLLYEASKFSGKKAPSEELLLGHVRRIAATIATESEKVRMSMAAALMGIHVDRVISLTFAIGGALGGAASVIYSLYINTVSFQMGFQNGLYAFTAAVLGGIGSIPGAVLGGLLIGLVRSLGSAYIGEKWTSALVFGILIIILVFRPSGLLGSHAKEKV